MAHQNVDVTFDVTTQTFHFVPPDVPENDKGGGTVTLRRVQNPQHPWKFVGAEVKHDTYNQFRNIDVHDEKVVIHNKNSHKGSYDYFVKVLDERTNARYDSPDPQIINSGPDSMFPSTAYVAVGVIVGAVVGALIDANTGTDVTRGMLKGLVVGAIIGAIIGLLLGRMLAGRRQP